MSDIETLEIELSDEFSSTMQQLVAEASKSAPPAKIAQPLAEDSAEEDRLEAMQQTLAAIARTMAHGFAKVAAPTPAAGSDHLADRLDRIEAQLEVARKGESVNQRLFNSLHEELKCYRDDFMRETLQKPILRDLITLYDDMSALSAQLLRVENANAQTAQWAENHRHAVDALLEILHRVEVSELEPQECVDRRWHKVISYELADFAEEDGRIVQRLKRGFLWHGKLFRAEEVIAKRFP